MIRLIFHRLAMGLVSMWVIYTLTFLMIINTPGNPFQVGERQMDPEIMRALESRYHVDNHLRYYFDYIYNVIARLDFGPSFQYKDWTVNQILSSSLPVSLIVGSLAMWIAVVVGLPLGVASAVRPGSWVDHLSTVVTLLGISVPAFAVATLLLGVFGAGLGIAPVGGWGGIQHVILPAVSLSLPTLAYLVRLTRNGMLEVLRCDYIRTAWAKGMPRQEVIWKHAFRNVLPMVLSYLGPAAAYVLTGSFVVETVFNVPGVGIHFVQSVQNLDRGLILAMVLMFSALVILFNIIVDLLCAWLDPRIREARS